MRPLPAGRPAMLLLGSALAVTACSAPSASPVSPAAAPRSSPTSTPAGSVRSSGPTSRPVRLKPPASDTGSARPSLARSATSPSSPGYVFPIAGCHVSYAAAHHDYPATDVFADRGCRVVSPVDGVVDEVRRTDRWSPRMNRGADRGGRFVSVVGDDGVRYYMAHLQVVASPIRPRRRVRAGERVGAVGDSGSARGTGTHLHFGISWPTAPGTWWVRRGMVLPSPYLDAWRAHRARSPVRAVAARHRAVGPAERCTSYC